MLALLLKCLIGALAVLLIALLSRSQNFYLAGLVPLFPTFALIAHVIVATERGPVDLQATALFGLWSLIPYAAYLLVVWYLCTRLALLPTLVAATMTWFAAAALMLMIWTRWR